ncbi:nucleotidyltransferase family protein [Xenorhabdus sp. Flor]|uniref:nucleotidyltransferase family protein n=1 Tax=Xenorhabdus cabanillasii TaxID=351673 RepID=UPI0019B3ED0F|nr:nucleotidyltransferase family protein [Xenorhabdus sp. Flor]MBD2816057.1 nucleotidyltransferase family protein [Xenorhabdus sp. Flor]
MYDTLDKKNIAAANYIINDYLDIKKDENLDNVISADLHFLGKHKLIPIWFDLIKKYGEVKKLTRQTYYMLSSYTTYMRSQQEIKLQEIQNIGKQFDQNNLPYAIRKGHALSFLYKDRIHRNYNDIDLLIDNSKIEKYLDILYSKGYIEGIYDYSKQEIIKHSRFDYIKYQLSPDHHPHLVKLIGDIPVVIDLAYTSCWHTHPEEKTFHISNVDTEIIDGVCCLSGKSLYYDTVFHLYRESRFLSSLEGRSPFLLNYIDLMLLKNSHHGPIQPTLKENEALEKDISVILSNDIGNILNYEVKLADIKKNTFFNIFLYTYKSSKKEAKKMIEDVKKKI